MDSHPREGFPPNPMTVGFNIHQMALPRPALPDHTLLYPIGDGSYGTVWLAVNVMGTRRAVKVVHRRNFVDDRPFERELTGIRKFEPISRSHDGFVDVLQIGRDEGAGYFYYVMELADPVQTQTSELEPPDALSGAPGPANQAAYRARTLRTEIELRGRLPAQECVGIGLALASALEHLHRNGLVHRDIKPSNIIFVNGQPKLADIGLVAALDEAHSLVGTQGFIPPEGPGTPQADVYSLGKVLYEMSSGKDRQAFPDPPTRLAELPDQPELLELDEVIHRACDTDSRRRYQTAAEMHEDLLLLRVGKSVKRLRVAERRLKMITRVAVAGVAVLLLGVVPCALAIKEARRARAAEAEAREQLRSSYLAQAEAGRFSHQAGRRFEGLELLHKAAQMRPSLELRNEAIACLALRDMRLSKEFPGTLPGSYVEFDSAGRRYGRREPSGDISVRSLEDDRELSRLPGFGAAEGDELDFSPDGRLLVAFKLESGINTVVIWDIEHASAVLSLTNAFVRNPAFTADSRCIVLFQRPDLMLVYDLRTKQMIASFEVRSLPMNFRLRPDGTQIAVSFTDSDTVQIFELPSGEIRKQLTGTTEVNNLSWHPAGLWLAGSQRDGNNVVWNLATGERLLLKAHSSASMAISFNADGRLLASTGWDGRLQLYDFAEGEEICSLPAALHAMAFGPDSRWIGCGSSYDKVGVLEVALGEECADLLIDRKAGREPKFCSFSADGRWLVSAHKDGLRLWDVTSCQQAAFQPCGAQVFSARFNARRGSIITASADEVSEWPVPAHEPGGSGPRIGPPRRLAAAPDEQWDYLGCNPEAVVLASAHTVQLLDIETGKLIRQLHGDANFRFAALSPDGKWCAAGTWVTNAVWVFDARSEAQARILPACAAPGSLGFSPDNRWLVVCGPDEYRFIQTSTWTVGAAVQRKASGGVRCRVAFAPDMRMVAVAYSAQVIRLLDPATGREFATLEPRELQNLSTLAFSPDGTRLAAGTWSQVIQMWDLRLIRNELAAMNLDWDLPPYPATPSQAISYLPPNSSRP